MDIMSIVTMVAALMVIVITAINYFSQKPQAEVIPFKQYADAKPGSMFYVDRPQSTPIPMSSYDINAKKTIEDARKKEMEELKKQVAEIATQIKRYDEVFEGMRLKIETLQEKTSATQDQVKALKEILERKNAEFSSAMGKMNRNINEVHTKLNHPMVVRIEGPVEFTKAPVKVDEPVQKAPEAKYRKSNGVKNRALFSEPEK